MALKLGLLLLISASFSLKVQGYVDIQWDGYDGYRVYAVTLRTPLQIKTLQDIVTSGQYLVSGGLSTPGKTFQLGVSPERIHATEFIFNDLDIEYSIYLHNLQTYLDREKTRLLERYGDEIILDFDINDFNTLSDIMDELPNMVARCPSEVMCNLYDIGTSYEGMPLTVLRIYKDEPDRMAFWIDSGIHSGEWLPLTTNLKIMDLMTGGYGTDEVVTALIDQYDWYFLPIMNPDGYEHTWQEDRFWRKSRNLNEGSTCNGTDLNRNFDQMWMNAGSSDDPCSNNYAGSGPASEPETQAVQAEAIRLAPTLLGFITLHSAAEMWLHPWGHVDEEGECAYAEDEDWMIQISNAAADAVENTFSDDNWTRGNTCETIYPASGTTMDFAKGGAGINYTCTPELRGPFDPVPADIELSFEEIWNGIQAMVEALGESYH